MSDEKGEGEPNAMGVDVGGRRVGLAVTAGDGGVATALRTVDTKTEGENSAVEAIVAECQQREIEVVVVGWPLRMDGTEGRAVQRVQSFMRRLTSKLKEAYAEEDEAPPELERWDERMTSREVNTALRETEMNRKRRGEVVDKLAATRILQSFLDARQHKADRVRGGEQ